uniref:Solute carrier family 22 member 8 n=2 Tax=Cacopsylla melanoneura TaxID=428564 RepID=A0A8D8Q685_9HEMI
MGRSDQKHEQHLVIFHPGSKLHYSSMQRNKLAIKPMKANDNATYNVTSHTKVLNNITVTIPVCYLSNHEIIKEQDQVTIVTEWDLTHSQAKWNNLVVTLYFLGVVLGSLPAGILADRFGRRVVMLCCFYCQAALSIIIVYNTSFVVYLVLRTLQGFFIQGLQNSSYTLLIELFPTRWRISVAWLTEICWTLGLVVLALISHQCTNWRQAELLTSLPFLCFSFIYVWFIPESPLWKYTKNKIIDFECFRDDESHGTSLHEYSTESRAKVNKGLEYLSPENFIVQHLKNVHSQTVPNMTMCKVNDSFLSSKTDANISDEFLTDNLNSYGSIEDLRVSLSSILSAFDVTIESYRQSLSLDNDTPCMRRGSKIINKTDDSLEKSNYEPDTMRLPVCDTKHGNAMVSHLPGDSPLFLINTGNSISAPLADDEHNSNSVAIARDKLLRQLNKCVQRECCKRKTLDELLILLEQKRVTKNDVRNVCREICESRTIRQRLIIMCYLWFSTSLSYYGVTFSVPVLSGDRYQNFVYGAGFEFVFFSASFFVLSKVGRKCPLITFYLLSSFLFTFVFLLSFFPVIQLTACSRTLLILLAKGSIVGTFFCVFIYCAELFPTPMRAACNGITSLCCRVGSLLSPYFLTYAMKISQDTMLLLIGILTLIAALLTFSLPETHQKKLPDTLDDALNLKK